MILVLLITALVIQGAVADLSTNSSLSSLSVNIGTLTPTFDQATTSYTINGLGTTDTDLVITADAFNENASIVFEGYLSLAQASPSAPVFVPSGSTSFNVNVYTVGNASNTVYTLQTNRPASTATTLTNAVFTSGLLQPSFSPSVYSYTLDVVHEDATVVAAFHTAHRGMTLTLDSTSIAVNGNISIASPVGNRVVNVTTTAEDGTAGLSYLFTIRRHNGESSLTSLSVTNAILTPSFQRTVQAYTAVVAFQVSSLTLSPVLNGTGSTVTVQGAAVASGGETGSISLDVGVNIILIKVTESNTVSTFEYGISVTREAFQSATDATLFSLSALPGTLSPAFTPAGTDYQVNIANKFSSVTISAYVNSPGASVSVAGVKFPPGKHDLTLFVGEGLTSYFIEVTAPDGTTKRIIRIQVYREPLTQPPSLALMDISDAGIPVVLNPSFNPAVVEYEVAVTLTTSSVLVKTAAATSISVLVNNQAPVPDGNVVPLGAGETLLEIKTSNTDGQTKVYKIRFLRGSGEAALSALTFSQGRLSPTFATAVKSYQLLERTTWSVVTATSTKTNATISIDGTTHLSTVTKNVTMATEASSLRVSVRSPNNANTVFYTISLPKVEPKTNTTVNAIQTTSRRSSVLNTLTVSGSIDPPFVSPANGTASIVGGVASYTVAIPAEQTSITIKAITQDTDALMTINDQDLTTGQTFTQDVPDLGTVLNIVVAAPDGSSTSEYKMVVTKLPKIQTRFVAFTPARGLDRGGTILTISGSALEILKAPVECQLGGPETAKIPAELKIPSDAGGIGNAKPYLTCEVPPSGTLGPVAVKIYSGGELVWAFATYFLYFNPLKPQCLDPSKPFLCGDGSCSQRVTGCPTTSCPSGSAVQCWDGACAQDILDCAPIPACPKTVPQLCDGLCIGKNDTCDADLPECKAGTKLCADNLCREKCAPTFSCPPATPIRCASGGCKATLALCNEGCPAGTVKCIDDSCVQDESECITPPSQVYPLPKNVGWDVSLNAVVLVVYNAEVPDEYVAWVTVPTNALEDSSGNTGMFLSVEPYPDSELRSITKPDNWESYEKGIFSTVLQVKVPENVTRPFNIPVQFKFKTILPHPIEELCFAYINTTSREFVCTDQKIAPVRGAYFTSIDHLTPVLIIKRPDPAIRITVKMTWQLFAIIGFMLPFLAAAYWYGRKHDVKVQKAFRDEQFKLYDLYLPPLADDDTRVRFQVVLNERMPKDLRLTLSKLGFAPRLASLRANMPGSMRYYDIYADPYSEEGAELIQRLADLGLIKFVHPGTLREGPAEDEEEAIPWERVGAKRIVATVSESIIDETEGGKRGGEKEEEEEEEAQDEKDKELARALGLIPKKGDEEDDDDDEEASSSEEEGEEGEEGEEEEGKKKMSRKEKKKRFRIQLAEEGLRNLGLQEVKLKPADIAAGAVSRWEILLDGDLGEDARQTLCNDIGNLRLVNLIDPGIPVPGNPQYYDNPS